MQRRPRSSPQFNHPLARRAPRGAFIAAWACALALGLAGAPAAADPSVADRNAARSLADKAADLFDSRKFAESIERFRQAEALVHAPTHLLYIARAYEKLDKIVEAHKTYDGIITDELITATAPPAFREAKAAAEQEDKKLLERIPAVRLSITSPDSARVQVTIDGKAIEPALLSAPILVNSGVHTIEASGAGLVSDSKQVSTSEGDRLNVSLSLRWQGPLLPGLIALGAGVAALGVGTITGAISLSKVGDLADRCPEKHCAPGEQAFGESARSLGTASTVGLIVGGALVGAGVALTILRPFGGPPAADAPAGSLRLRVGLGTAALEGTF